MFSKTESEANMGDEIKKSIWQSIHSDYLRFAVLSVRACEQGTADSTAHTYVNRNVIEAIRYSYDCFESSVEFIFHMGCLNQLPVTLNDNWLSRYTKREWDNLSLSNRIGILTFAWTGKDFWQAEYQYQLFKDLKKIRDGLTHPIPFGTEIETKIITQEVTTNGTFTESRQIGEGKQLKPDRLVYQSKAVAQFEPSVKRLDRKDAEQALEILLRHLIRLEDIFFGRRTTWFSFYNDSTNSLLSTEDLIRSINCRFEQVWQGNSDINS